jgi:hypothetical protein
MDAITKAEVLAIGAIIIAVALFSGYELFENREIVKEIAESGVVQAALGLPLLEEGKKVVEIDYEVGKDLIEGEVNKATEDYLSYEGGQAAVKWLHLFGDNIYNDGFLSTRYTSLRENAEVMSKRHGDPYEYFKKIGTIGMTRTGNNEVVRISPYEIRKNLDSLPFSNELHGLFGTSAATLKSEVWTDWDKLPEQVGKWSQLTEHEKNKIKEMRDEDKEKLESFRNLNDSRTWIVEDRVLAWNEILIRNGIAL